MGKAGKGCNGKMEILFVKEKSGQLNAAAQLKNLLVSRIESAFQLTNTAKTESLILPIVPTGIIFPKIADVENYDGLTMSYNIPGKKKLEDISWSSIFPVYKNYSFQKRGSNLNGYDYKEFLEERQANELPFRLVAFERRNIPNTASTLASNIANRTVSLMTTGQSLIKILFDDLVVVKDFKPEIDTVGDIKYSLTLSQFNSELLIPKLNYSEIATGYIGNTVTKHALRQAGLI